MEIELIKVRRFGEKKLIGYSINGQKELKSGKVLVVCEENGKIKDLLFKGDNTYTILGNIEDGKFVALTSEEYFSIFLIK